MWKNPQEMFPTQRMGRRKGFVWNAHQKLQWKKKKKNSNDYLELKSRGKNPSHGSMTWGLSAMV